MPGLKVEHDYLEMQGEKKYIYVYFCMYKK